MVQKESQGETTNRPKEEWDEFREAEERGLRSKGS
jgi:hypothetical protein